MAKKRAPKGHAYEQLDTAFRNDNFKPLYFLYGDERYLMQSLQETLIAHALAPHERDFNLDIVYGPDIDVQRALSLCASYPVMATRRVIIIRDFDKLKDNRRFAAYAEHPNPTAVVLLQCSGKPNLSAHPYRALRQHAVWAECKPLRAYEMTGWLNKHVRSRGLEIEPAAVQMLADFVGTSLESAVHEVDKLTTYAGERTRLVADDVIRASGQTREFNVFELQKAIGTGRYPDAMRITERLLQQASTRRGEALRIVSVLTSYFTKLWVLTVCQAQRMPDRDMAQRVGISPFFVKEYLASLRRFDLPAIEGAFQTLLAADYELKGGAQRDERLVLTLMLRRLVPVS